MKMYEPILKPYSLTDDGNKTGYIPTGMLFTHKLTIDMLAMDGTIYTKEDIAFYKIHDVEVNDDKTTGTI